MKKKVQNQETQPLLSKKDNDDIVVFDQQISLNDQKFFKLPDQVPCDFKGEQNKINLNELKNQPLELLDLGIQLSQHFEKVLKVWNVDSNHKYYFNIPPSYFLKEIEIQSQNSQNMDEEQYVVRKLSQKQIEQIYQTGTFEIASKNFPIPYVWQLSAWVIKGKEKILQSFYYDLSFAYRNIRFIPMRFKSDDDHKGSKFPLTFRSGLYNILYKISIYPSLFIGYPHSRRMFDKNQVKCILEGERQKNVKSSVKFSVALYEYMFYRSSKDSVEEYKARQRVQKLIEFASKFDQEAEGLKQQMQNYYDLQVEQRGSILEVDNDEKREYQQNILNQINEQAEDYMKKYNIAIDINMDINLQIEQAKYNAQIQMWNNDKSLGKELKQSIFNLSECTRIHDYYYKQYQAKKQQLTEDYRNKVKSQNPIRGQYLPFVNQSVKSYITPIRKQLKQDMYEQIIRDLTQNKIPEADLMKNFLEFKKQFKDKFNKLYDQYGKEKRLPLSQFRLTRYLFPKYEVEKVGDYYQLKRTQIYNLDTQNLFWRVKLGFYRWFIWTNNEMYFLFANAFVGPLGIKALFSIKDFHPDVECDRKTGVIRPSYYKVTPVIGRFIRVYDGMTKSRQHFENAPDTGLFGKNLARVWNLFEVYIFRFLLVGILYVLIFQPILIIANTTISLALAVTAWIWTPILLILKLLFSLLIYDHDYGVYRRKLRETQNWFPILALTYRLLIYGVLQVVLSLLFAIVLHPLAIIICSLFGCLRWFLRRSYDLIMIQMVRLLGRVPAKETNLAWKISGPGLSRQFYQQISNADVIILIAAQLEKVLLKEYEKRLVLLINQPSFAIQQQINRFFSIFEARYSFSDQGANLLKNWLSEQIQKREQKIPKFSNSRIRFTKNELNFILRQSKTFIKKQIILKDMGQYIWEYYDTKVGDYNGLVEKILSKIFRKEVLEPFEDLEMRFKLKENEVNSYSHKIERALEGQINLEMPSSFEIKTKNQKNAPQITKPFVHYREVIQETWSLQGLKQSWVSIQRKKGYQVNYILEQ